jgi:hypothetical protein
MVAAASRRWCRAQSGSAGDAIAITDHADSNLRGQTPEYFDAIDKARAAHRTW